MQILAALPAIFTGASVGLSAAKLLSKPKAQQQAAAPLPLVTRDAARASLDAERELARRKGGAADIVTGTRGAEATANTGRLVLGS